MKKKITEKLSELGRRDKFLIELEETCPIHYEGTDIVADAFLMWNLSSKFEKFINL